MRWQGGKEARWLGGKEARWLGGKVGLLLCLLASLPPTTLRAQDPTALIRRASSVYRGLTSLQADFVQVIEDAGLGDTLTTTGKLYQS